MPKHNFLKKELKLIANLYAASILIESDCGWNPEEEGLTMEDAHYIISYLNKTGEKMRGDHNVSSSSLTGIVEYVNNLYYEMEGKGNG